MEDVPLPPPNPDVTLIETTIDAKVDELAARELGDESLNKQFPPIVFDHDPLPRVLVITPWDPTEKHHREVCTRYASYVYSEILREGKVNPIMSIWFEMNLPYRALKTPPKDEEEVEQRKRVKIERLNGMVSEWNTRIARDLRPWIEVADEVWFYRDVPWKMDDLIFRHLQHMKHKATKILTLDGLKDNLSFKSWSKDEIEDQFDSIDGHLLSLL